MGRGPGRPRLSEVMDDANNSKGEITTDEAAVLIKIGMSGADVNDKARWAITYFLQALVAKDSIGDEDAKVCLDILRQAATSEQKLLCNKVLEKYVSRFNFAQPGAYAAEKVAKAALEPVVV